MIINTDTDKRREIGRAMCLSIDEFIEQLPAGLELVERASLEFNCEAYAIGGSGTIRNGLFDTMERIPDTYAQEGDIVVYADHFGDVLHVGRYLGNGKVISKWGRGPVIRHPLAFVPSCYGELVSFLRKLEE